MRRITQNPIKKVTGYDSVPVTPYVRPYTSSLLGGPLLPQDTDKLRLTYVSIVGLFGRYNHDFSLAQNDRVTILHGPNGIGKTAVLRLLFAVFAGRTFQIFSTKFSSLTLDFEGGARLHIARATAESDETAEHISVRSTDRLGLVESLDAFVDRRTLTKFASSIARRVPWLERVGDDMWIDRRSAERLTTNELLSKFEGSDPDLQSERIGIGEQIRPLLKIHNTLQSLSKLVDVHIIETQRLLTKTQKIERRPSYRSYDGEGDGDADVRTTVNECAEELKKRIAASLSRYATESQRRDQTFPFRLLRLASHSPVDRVKLQQELREIGDKRKQLSEVGLLVEKSEPYGDDLERLDIASADDAQLRVIELYAGDTSGKLATLDEVLQIARLFFKIVNVRFKHKRLTLDKERGLVATTDNQDVIRLDALSSGEQHQLVMFFDLLFKVRRSSLVLIDEPELSLHVNWQKSLLESLIEISAQKSLDILVATHSPYIVGGRIELLRDLSSPDYQDNAEF